MEKKVAVITGGSRGIGRECAISLSLKGYSVYELSRRGEDICSVKHITADVTNEDSIRKAVKNIFDKEGRIDILINNAGMGISGALEFTELSDAEKQFNVNRLQLLLFYFEYI